MKNYHLNKNLISTLPRVLRMTHAEIINTTGIAGTTWYRIAGDPAIITVQQLIQLANKLCIPIRKFFILGRTTLIGLREDYIVFNGYKPCSYSLEAVHQRLGTGTATSWQKAAKAIGMHWTSTAACMQAQRPLPVERLLTICNTFQFDLFDFLIDPNQEVPHTKRGAGERMQGEISELRQQVADLQNAMLDLSMKYDSLLAEYRKLASSIHYEIHHFTDSNIAIAAEPQKESNTK